MGGWNRAGGGGEQGGGSRLQTCFSLIPRGALEGQQYSRAGPLLRPGLGVAFCTPLSVSHRPWASSGSSPQGALRLRCRASCAFLPSAKGMSAEEGALALTASGMDAQPGEGDLGGTPSACARGSLF